MLTRIQTQTCASPHIPSPESHSTSPSSLPTHAHAQLPNTLSSSGGHRLSALPSRLAQAAPQHDLPVDPGGDSTNSSHGSVSTCTAFTRLPGVTWRKQQRPGIAKNDMYNNCSLAGCLAALLSVDTKPAELPVYVLQDVLGKVGSVSLKLCLCHAGWYVGILPSGCRGSVWVFPVND